MTKKKLLDELVDDISQTKNNSDLQNKMIQNHPETVAELLNLSEEDIEKVRQEKLDNIEKSIKILKDQVNREELDKYVLETKIELLEKAKYILNEFMVNVLMNLSSNARAYEVLSEMFKTVAELNASVLKKEDAPNVNIKVDNKMPAVDATAIAQSTNDLIASLIDININKKNFRDQEKKNITVVNGKK